MFGEVLFVLMLLNEIMRCAKAHGIQLDKQFGNISYYISRENTFLSCPMPPYLSEACQCPSFHMKVSFIFL